MGGALREETQKRSCAMSLNVDFGHGLCSGWVWDQLEALHIGPVLLFHHKHTASRGSGS